MIRHLAVMGATGHLVARYLVPALASLHARDELPEGFSVIAMARSELDTDEYRRQTREAVESYAEDVDGDIDPVIECITYQRADVTDESDLAAALGDLNEAVAVYLALPPAILAPALRALCSVSLPEGSRIAIEKPFGEDLDSARELNALAHEALEESAVFRVDHFLATAAAQNIPCLRFANPLLEAAWNREHVERVEITWDEARALEGRAGYYDAAGALRDMIQNHLMQLLCLVAMEPPIGLGERDFRDRKVDVLRAIHRMTPDEVDARTVRARYTAGRLDGDEVPAYADEEGVDPEYDTETFAQVELSIDNWRWAGVPFVIRTGKALKQDRNEITLHFRSVPHAVFSGDAPPSANLLRINFDPASVTLRLDMKCAGSAVAPEPVEMQHDLPSGELPPYARVLLGILHGDFELSVRDDEAEEAWRVVEPILEAWAEGRSPLREYPAGSDGPDAA